MTQPDSTARDRVSIHYKDHETQDERELPLKILVLGDFRGHPNPLALEQRVPVRVDGRNLGAVMAAIAPGLRFVCPSALDGDPDARLSVDLKFSSLADWEPEALAARVPELRTLILARRGLSRLKAWLPSRVGERIHELLVDPVSDVDIEDQVDSVLAVSDLVPDDPEHIELRAGVGAYLRAYFGVGSQPGLGPVVVDRASVDPYIAAIDQVLARQLDTILHDPRVQALEAIWRSLVFLLERVEFRENSAVFLLDCAKQDLVDDFEDAPEIAKSGLHRLVYATEYGTFGGEPYGLIVCDYEFGPGPVDMTLLGNCAAVAAMAHVPFIANAAPRLFGEPSFEALAAYTDLRAIFQTPAYARWTRFRDTEDARYVGLCLPRFVVRAPYPREAVSSFRYAERTARTCDYLWGHAAFAFATRVADSFARYRWSPNIVGPTAGGAIDGLVELGFASMRARQGGHAIERRMPTEIQLTERHEFELSEEGLIGLVHLKGSDQACFFSANSCQRPKSFTATVAGRDQALGARLGAQLPYVFIVCRIAHYLKVLQREQIGRHLERGDLERELNDWLRQYVSDMDNPAPAIRGKRPLRQAEVVVEEVAGQAGWYRAHLRLRPHLKYMGASFTLSLVGKLERDA